MDINFITKSVTVTRGLPDQVERIQELEKENQRLREALRQLAKDGPRWVKWIALEALKEKE